MRLLILTAALLPVLVTAASPEGTLNMVATKGGQPCLCQVDWMLDNKPLDKRHQISMPVSVGTHQVCIKATKQCKKVTVREKAVTEVVFEIGTSR